MNTRRVPGLTRNSGWQAVDAEIVRARAAAQQPDGTTTTPSDVRADGAARQPSTGR